MFESLEQAEAAYKKLESEKDALEDEKSKLIAKRDELLGKLTTQKARFAKFEEYADQDIDIAELLRLKETAGKDEEAIKSRFEEAYRKDKNALEQRLKAIEEERRLEKEAREQEQKEASAAKLRADALSELTKEKYGIRNPEQFWLLFGQGRVERDEKDKLIFNGEGLPKPLPEYIEAIASQDENLHHFKLKGGSGGGTPSGTGNPRRPGVNPWKKGDTWNLTQQGQILKQNPELAKRLKSEAGVK